MSVTGIILAAGNSTRLGRPKQMLRLGHTTLLGRTLETVSQVGLDQIVLVLGANAPQIRMSIDLGDVDVVEARTVDRGAEQGCSLSIAAALDAVHEDAAGIVLFLGDQPFVDRDDVARLLDAAATTEIAVCRYRDGRGHPFWFRRSMFDPLRSMHGDKAVWKLLSSGQFTVVEVAVDRDIPLDVDDWHDYEALVAMDSLR